MKHIQFILLFFFIFSSCDSSDPEQTNTSDKDVVSRPTPEKRVGINDLVLLYGGNSNRKYTWSKDLLKPYVAMQEEDGSYHWLFDGFLLLELKTGDGHDFASYYEGSPARKKEWNHLLDYYLGSQKVVSNLDEVIAEYKGKVKKELPRKHQLVITLPEPIPNQKNWGEVNGKKLDFNLRTDRLAACKWYIDTALEMFQDGKFKNIELAGFYWLAEEADNSRDLIRDLRNYIHNKDKKMQLLWIPYFVAGGNTEWRSIGFDKAYLQPNYFFDDKIGINRLNKACNTALKYGMGMELEFDNRVLTTTPEKWGYRLRDYIDVFEKYEIWKKREVAYYQGEIAWYYLSHSTVQEERELYLRLARLIAKRQKDGIEK